MRKLLFLLISVILLIALCVTAHADPSLQDLSLVGGDHTVTFSFTLEGYDTALVSYSSSQEKGSMTVTADSDGVFSGVIEVPATYAANYVYISIQNVSGKRTFLNREKVQTAYVMTEPAEQAAEGRLKGVTVCIDPGHMKIGLHGISEPKGPGLTGTSNRTGQAQGVKTRRYEYIVCYEVAEQLRDALLQEGATVIMTKDDPDQFRTNVERATIANDAEADIFIRLHCDNNSNANKRGISVYVPLHSDYARAVGDTATYLGYADALGGAMSEATGVSAHSRGNDNYVASNWARMPAFLVEMGYMSNAAEDVLMSDPAYQSKLVTGMVNGIERVMIMRGVIGAE